MNRRTSLGGLLALVLALSGAAGAQSEPPAGAFTPRMLSTGGRNPDPLRRRGAARWAHELELRTSIISRPIVEVVRADSPRLLSEPFVIWAGDRAVPPLTRKERSGLRQFLDLGGVLIVDDSEPTRGDFTRSVQRELSRVIPDAPPVALPSSHVLFRSFYRLKRASGRVKKPERLEASLRRGIAQVIYLRGDLLGALATSRDGNWALSVEGSPGEREQAVRTAVNLVLYTLCSDYKDDQVHATYLMRRRSRRE